MKGKDKGRPIICHEGTEGKYRYSCTVQTSALQSQRHAPAALQPGNDSVQIAQEAGLTPGQFGRVLAKRKSITPAGDRTFFEGKMEEN